MEKLYSSKITLKMAGEGRCIPLHPTLVITYNSNTQCKVLKLPAGRARPKHEI